MAVKKRITGWDINQITDERLRPRAAYPSVGLLNANRAAAVVDDLSVNNGERMLRVA